MMLKRFLLVGLVFAGVWFLGGCVKPPNYNGVVSIQTNEIAFLVDMTGDGSVAAGDSDIQRKDISIPGYWVRTGRFDYTGYWRPAVKVVVVSAAPVRLDWDASEETRTVRMVSLESSGFVVSMSVNAYIDSRQDAYLYLSSFKPVGVEVDWSGLSQKNWGPYVKEEAQPLEVALNSVVYTKLLEQLAQLFVKTPVLYAEVASKIYLLAVFDGMTAAELSRRVVASLPEGAESITFEDDVPSLREWAKNTYGITITAMAPGDGVFFDNVDVQRQIDALAVGVMKERALEQDRINAQKEQEVRRIAAVTARIEAEAKSSPAVIAAMRAQAEIDIMRLEGEARAEAIRRGNYAPVPSTLITGADLSAFGFPGLSNLVGR